jgi:ATP-binding cassette, subfamily D (ALD), peroxisomal long-chain fatty acid import protein
MGMARLFYHEPRFGVLDECTSAVSVDVETQLYAAASARGISCLTFSQRLALDQFHSLELKLGESNPVGWTKQAIGV